jgi:hypothetical protein
MYHNAKMRQFCYVISMLKLHFCNAAYFVLTLPRSLAKTITQLTPSTETPNTASFTQIPSEL